MNFVRYVYENSPEKLIQNNLIDCIECGACAYICPSNVPLMGSIFEGKMNISNL